MILVPLAAAAAQASAVEAERAFAAKAQTDGQWTAFRAYAAPDALMFVPKPVRAHDWLKGRKDPKIGYMWWPAAAYVSCDGKTAVTTGPSLIGKSRGYFTTIWQRQADGGWKWVLDHGDALERPRPAAEKVVERRASCTAVPKPQGRPQLVSVETSDGAAESRPGASADNSLTWAWTVNGDGSRHVKINLWNGSNHDTVIDDRVAGAR